VVKGPKSSLVTPILRSLHWLKINEGIEYKLLSFTYKVLTTSQPDYLHNLISVQSSGRTRSSSVVTLARPSVSSSLQITNRSFRYAPPHLWNQLPSSFRQPHSVYSPPGSSHPAHITSSQSPPSLSSPITASTFHSRLKTHLFHTSFLHSHSYSFQTAFTHMNLYWIKSALAFVCFSSFFFHIYFFLATCAKAEYSAFESTLNSSLISYRQDCRQDVLRISLSSWDWQECLAWLRLASQFSVHAVHQVELLVIR